MIPCVQQGLRAEGVAVGLSQLCRWFEVARRTVYDQTVKVHPKVEVRYAEPIKALIEENSSFGYRTVARTCSGSTRTPCSVSSSSRAGK